MTTKAIRKALIVARQHRASGGATNPPLLGDPAVEAVEDEQGHQTRKWLPSVSTGPSPLQNALARNLNLPTAPDKPNIVKQEMVAPVFRSLSHDILADPNTLGGMKQGNPQQWVNALTKAGAKKEELEWLKLHEGHPNTKLTRDYMLARAKQHLPQLSEKLMGERGKETVQTGGDEDDYNPYESMRHNQGEWETDEPDEGWITERAEESLRDHLPELVSDPDKVSEHLPEVLDEYADHWLHSIDPDQMPEHRVAGFMHEAVARGWALPEKAKAVIDEKLKRGNISNHTWRSFVDDTVKGVADKFGETSDEDEHPELPFGLEPKPSGQSTTEDYLEPFNDAVKRLHGYEDPAATYRAHLTNVPVQSQPPRADKVHGDTPEIMANVEDKLQEKLLSDYEDQEREYYKQDDEAPRTRTHTIEDDYGNEKEYKIHDQGYGGEYYITDPRGRHIGTTNSEDEAEERIMSHAIDNYDWGDPNRGVSYEEREVPTDNMTVPDTTGSPRFKSYSLPGIENYR